MSAYGKDNFSTMATVPSHACPLSIDGKSLRFKFILVSLLHLNAVTKASFLSSFPLSSALQSSTCYRTTSMSITSPERYAVAAQQKGHILSFNHRYSIIDTVRLEKTPTTLFIHLCPICATWCRNTSCRCSPRECG